MDAKRSTTILMAKDEDGRLSEVIMSVYQNQKLQEFFQELNNESPLSTIKPLFYDLEDIDDN